MHLSDSKAAQRVADHENLVGELVEALSKCIHSLEYVNENFPETGGYTTRNWIMDKARIVLDKAKAEAQQ